MQISIYRCSDCHASLIIKDGLPECDSCGKIYPVTDGVIVFPSIACEKYTPTAGRMPEESLKRFVRALKESNNVDWRELYRKNISVDSYYVTDYSRADFKCLLPINKNAVLLEIGSSFGQICLNIAPSVKEAWAIETGELQCIASKLIAEKEGRDNFNVAHGGGEGFLPYKDNVFDIVVMNNVIEWVGGRAYPAKPYLIQSRILSEVKRVLKNGGTFYISTKNRFALQYLIGGIDEHFNIRFGNALPRRLIGLYEKFGWNTTTLLHSVEGLKRMLCEAGLKAASTYWVIPDVRKPSYYIPLTNKMVKYACSDFSIIAAMPRKYRFFIRFLPTPCFQNIIYSFAVIGTNDGK